MKRHCHILTYSREVIRLITLLLGKFAEGFEYQKGAIFGFGIGKIMTLKICNLSLIAELDQAQVNNLNEERSVGFLNYELDIRRKQHLEAASRKMVLNKAAYLIDVPGESFKTSRKPAIEIKDIRLEWNAKMKEEKGFSAKQIFRFPFVFRLKQNGKNFRNTYASNLCKFLDQSRSIKNLTMSDLRNVLTGLS